MITARCHPALFDLLPPPIPAGKGLPQWLRAMPQQVASPTLGGQMVRSVKHCPPFVDAMACGVLILTPCDIRISDGQLAWDWDFPIITDAPITRAPIGLHVPEQASGMPLDLDGQVIVKFTNYWTLATPQGWDLLFTHPLNRPDLPFHTLSGLVQADQFTHGYVHFPAVWTDAAFAGVLPKGTPIAQVIAVPRAAPALDIAPMSQSDIRHSRSVQEALQASAGVYRKSYRS